MNDALRIAVRGIAMALRFHFATQLIVVVDFTVVDHGDRAVFIADGLVPCGEIDDAEPAHGQPNVPFDEEAIVIRPAVSNLPVHPLQNSTVDLARSTVKDA